MMLNAPMKFVDGNEDHTTISTTPQAATDIPTMANGERPKYVACVHNGGIVLGGPGMVHIAFGDSTVAVTATSGFPIPAHECTLFDVSGFTHYAIVAAVSTIDFTIVPLENF